MTEPPHSDGRGRGVLVVGCECAGAWGHGWYPPGASRVSPQGIFLLRKVTPVESGDNRLPALLGAWVLTHGETAAEQARTVSHRHWSNTMGDGVDCGAWASVWCVERSQQASSKEGCVATRSQWQPVCIHLIVHAPLAPHPLQPHLTPSHMAGVCAAAGVGLAGGGCAAAEHGERGLEGTSRGGMLCVPLPACPAGATQQYTAVLPVRGVAGCQLCTAQHRFLSA